MGGERLNPPLPFSFFPISYPFFQTYSVFPFVRVKVAQSPELGGGRFSQTLEKTSSLEPSIQRRKKQTYVEKKNSSVERKDD